LNRRNLYLALALGVVTVFAWIVPIAVYGFSFGARILSPEEVSNAYTALPLEVPTLIFAWLFLVVCVGYFVILSTEKWVVRAIPLVVVPLLVLASSSYAHSVAKDRIGNLPLEFAYDNAGKIFFFGSSLGFLILGVGLYVYLLFAWQKRTAP